MCERSVPEVPSAVRQRLERARTLAVVSHARPDGDALGSMAALVRSARLAGREARAVLTDALPGRYEFLFAGLGVVPAEQAEAELERAELVVVVDTSASAQLDALADPLARLREKVLVLDHHVSSEDIAAAIWQDESAAAAGVLVGETIDALGWPMDVAVAEALAVALTTDTGWLRFANTDARALRCLARWLEHGLKVDELYMRLYQTDRPHRLALMTRMLESLRLHFDQRLATMVIRHADFDATGARYDETENLVNEPMRLAGVEVALLLVENTECVRVSLRSRQKVDVAELARRFGGGGHRRAAGLRLKEDVDVLLGKLIDLCGQALG